jgi:hypothetical protein
MPSLDRAREYARSCLALVDSGAPPCVADLELTQPYGNDHPLPLREELATIEQQSHVVSHKRNARAGVDDHRTLRRKNQ